jgi:tetratricopeptide (TPR) repeat protein
MTDKLTPYQKRWLKKANEHAKDREFGDAGAAYRKAGKEEEAVNYFLMAAEECIKEGDFWYTGEAYRLAGKKEEAKDYYLMAAKEFAESGNFLDAGRSYGEAGKFKEAAECYAKEGSISDIEKLIKQKKIQKKNLFKLVSCGDIKVTQTLAKLVKTEEDELMFNEARAGWVL